MDDPGTATTVSLAGGTATATLDLLGGRLTSMVVDGLELLVREGDDQFHWGSFPMAPWAGRLRHGRLAFGGRVVQLPVNAPPHALHGLVTDRVWELLTADEGSVSIAVDLGVTASDPWPWRCRVVQSVAVHEHGADFGLEVHAEDAVPAHVGWHPWFRRSLRPEDPAPVRLEVHAEDAVPAHVGWHPWFRRSLRPEDPAPVRLEVGSGQVFLNGPDGLPTGELGAPPPGPWDYCFVGLAEPPRVRWPGVLELTVDSDCEHWVLFDAEPAGICVEPWTGPPNCLNGPEARIISSDQPLTASMSWRWRHLDA